jgi:hypothetical protein
LIEVSARPEAPVAQVTSLRCTATAVGRRGKPVDLALDSRAPLVLPPAIRFRMEVPPSLRGPFQVLVEARGADGGLRGAGEGATDSARSGASVRVTLDRLGNNTADAGSGDDLANPGGAPTWIQTPSGTNVALNAIGGTWTDDAWAVGGSGTILHWNGTRWSPVPSPTTETLTGIWAASSNDAWAVGEHSTRLHWSSLWTRTTFENGQTFSHLAGRAVYGGDTGEEMWAVGGGSAAHWVHSAWSTTNLNTVAASGVCLLPDFIPWVVGGSDLLHWEPNANNWQKTSGGASDSYDGVWGSADDDLWVVGGGCKIWHWQGTALSPVASNATCQMLTAVWGSGPTDVWAVGTEATVLHWDGKLWSRVSTPVASGRFSAVWGSGPWDVWIVGTDGIIVHYH